MTDSCELELLVRTRYGVPNPSVHPLGNSWDGSAYVVTGADSAPRLLRMAEVASALADVRVLSFLAGERFHAPRLVPASAGARTVNYGSRAVLITTFVEGAPADFSPGTLYKLGERLGELHSLPWETNRSLPPAAMLPAADMRTALQWLRPVARPSLATPVQPVPLSPS